MKSKLLLLAVLPAFLLFFSCGNDENKKDSKETVTTTDSDKTEKEEKETETKEAEVFTSKDFGFSILFPKKPIEDTESVPTEVGNITMATFMYEGDDHVYFVAVSERPKLLIELSDDDDLLIGGVEGMLGEFGNVEVLKNEAISLGDHAGRVMEATGTTGGTAVYNKAHIFLVENSLFQIYVLAEKDKADKTAIDKFINSFELLSEE